MCDIFVVYKTFVKAFSFVECNITNVIFLDNHHADTNFVLTFFYSLTITNHIGTARNFGFMPDVFLVV